MSEVRSYPKHEVPPEIGCQISSGLQMIWPQLKIWTPGPPSDQITFVLLENDLVLSHAEVNFRPIELDGENYEVGGLSAVFTYPAHRGTGAGERVVQPATEHLKQSKADIALLFCGERVRSLYGRCGWQLIRNARIQFGDKENPALEKCLTMALMMTDAGRRARKAIESGPVYVGQHTW